MDARTAWDALGEPWKECFRLGWSAYGRRTIPVGAALVDPSGAIVATGRNHIYEQGAVSGDVSASVLAHAEVNALVGLCPSKRYEDHTLYTILEPCLLCVGAATMATVGTVAYAGADPYAGAAGIVGTNPHIARIGAIAYGPDPGPFGRLAEALHVAYFLEKKPQGHVVAAHRSLLPDAVSTAAALLDLGLGDAARDDVELHEVLPLAWPVLARAGSPERSVA